MFKLLLAAAALTLSLGAAHAECSYHRSVQASQPEQTVVASNETDQALTAQTATPMPAAEQVKPAQDATQPAE